MSKLVVTLAVVLSLASVACGGSKVVQGEVDHKTVTGVVEDVAFTILRNVSAHDLDAVDDRPSIRVKDQDFQRFFTSKDEHAIITIEMENQLRQKYTGIRYVVNVRVPDVGGGTRSYFVSRELFNRIRVDSPVAFEASGNPIPTMKKLLEPQGSN